MKNENERKIKYEKQRICNEIEEEEWKKRKSKENYFLFSFNIIASKKEVERKNMKFTFSEKKMDEEQRNNVESISH